ncbi:hypothetical protein Ddc_10068 [Ditylenchus destructor]|nr:hypothetical protein Ddc_10068 [Ditylenchus destructor]
MKYFISVSVAIIVSIAVVEAMPIHFRIHNLDKDKAAKGSLQSFPMVLYTPPGNMTESQLVKDLVDLLDQNPNWADYVTKILPKGKEAKAENLRAIDEEVKGWTVQKLGQETGAKQETVPLGMDNGRTHLQSAMVYDLYRRAVQSAIQRAIEYRQQREFIFSPPAVFHTDTPADLVHSIPFSKLPTYEEAVQMRPNNAQLKNERNQNQRLSPPRIEAYRDNSSRQIRIAPERPLAPVHRPLPPLLRLENTSSLPPQAPPRNMRPRSHTSQNGSQTVDRIYERQNIAKVPVQRPEETQQNSQPEGDDIDALPSPQPLSGSSLTNIWLS